MTKSTPVSDETLAILFDEARTHMHWDGTPVGDDVLRRLYDLVRMAPTGGNAQPLRIVFVRTPEAKERLIPALYPLNVDKTRAAPVTAILAWDARFHDHMPRLFPMRPERRDEIDAMGAAVIERLGTLNATLQGGYFILAARALGLDCGPMGGFDREKVDAAFFAGTAHKTFLLVNLGHGVPDKLHPRLPRLEFADACRFE